MTATPKAERACSKCGCTDRRACQGGCFWIGPNLCSACGKPPPIFLRLKATRIHRRKR